MGKSSHSYEERLDIAKRMKIWIDNDEEHRDRPHEKLKEEYGRVNWQKDYPRNTYKSFLKRKIISPPRSTRETEEEDAHIDIEGDPDDDEVPRPQPPLASLLSLS